VDNKINEIRRKIITLRGAMRETERAMRAEIAHDCDCSRAAQTLIGQRLEMARLANERKALGDLTPIEPDFGNLHTRGRMMRGQNLPCPESAE
jgi:hypothetical protein